MTPSRRIQAFTLVELLVVITIIGVLIAMLLPALGKARQQAQTLSCLSKMRGLELAQTNYIGDNHEVLPPGATWSNSSGSWLRANPFPTPLFYTNPSASTVRYTCYADYLYTYLQTPNAFHCPAINGVLPGASGNFRDYTHYGQSLYLNPMPRIWWGITAATDKLSQITRPSERINYAETSIDGQRTTTASCLGWVTAFDNNWFLMPYRHGQIAGANWATAWKGSEGSANYIFLDGHGAAMSGDTSGLFSCASLGGAAAGYRVDPVADRDRLWNGS